MKKLLKKNQNVFVVPEDVKGALSSKIKKFEKNILEICIDKDDMQYYSSKSPIEVFTVVDEGMLYFKTEIGSIDAENNVLSIAFDKKNSEILQRREYTRIDLDKEFTLKDGEKDYVCKFVDLSAGGMKILTDADLSTEKDYLIEFSLESNIPIGCYFKPIRVDEIHMKNKPVKKVVSGRFIALKNIDKIAIVQFCFKKQTENTNK